MQALIPVPRIVSGGKKNIAGADSTASTSYVTLSTPDLVTVVMPTDGLLAVWYQAIWKDTVGTNAKAAIFLGANQASLGTGTGAPGVQEATISAATDEDILWSNGRGLDSAGGVGVGTEVTTGQIIGANGGAASVGWGGPCYLFAAAGTYDVAIKFKNVAAGTLTASKRHLWVAAYDFAPV